MDFSWTLPDSTWTQQLEDRTALVHEARCVCGSEGEGSGQVARWAFFLAANQRARTHTHSLIQTHARTHALRRKKIKNKKFYPFGLSDRVYLPSVIWGVRGPLPEPELLAAAALRVRSLQLLLQGHDDDDDDALAPNPRREHEDIYFFYFIFLLQVETKHSRL